MLIAQKKNIKVFADDNGQDLLASGEVDACQEWNGDIIQVMAEDEDIAYAVPTEGSLLWQDTMAIPTGAPHPENAHAFLNFVLDAEAGKHIAETIQYATANAAAKAADGQVLYGESGDLPAGGNRRQMRTQPLSRRRGNKGARRNLDPHPGGLIALLQLYGGDGSLPSPFLLASIQGSQGRGRAGASWITGKITGTSSGPSPGLAHSGFSFSSSCRWASCWSCPSAKGDDRRRNLHHRERLLYRISNYIRSLRYALSADHLEIDLGQRACHRVVPA